MEKRKLGKRMDIVEHSQEAYFCNCNCTCPCSETCVAGCHGDIIRSMQLSATLIVPSNGYPSWTRHGTLMSNLGVV